MANSKRFAKVLPVHFFYTFKCLYKFDRNTCYYKYMPHFNQRMMIQSDGYGLQNHLLIKFYN